MESDSMKTTNREEFEKQNVFGTGTANTAYAHFYSFGSGHHSTALL